MDDRERKTGHPTGGKPEGSGNNRAPSARRASEKWDALGPIPNAVPPATHEAAQAHQSGRIVFRTPLAKEIEAKALVHEEMRAEVARAVGSALRLPHLPLGPWSTMLAPQEDDQERTVGER